MTTSGQSAVLSVLCKFLFEDGIWTAVAEDLPVVVSGQTFEQARDNLRDGLRAYFESAIELGQIGGVLKTLQEKAREHWLALEEMPPSRPLVRMIATVTDEQSVAIAG